MAFGVVFVSGFGWGGVCCSSTFGFSGAGDFRTNLRTLTPQSGHDPWAAALLPGLPVEWVQTISFTSTSFG
ncbi:MAG: hypothetical protein EHM41_00845 [Chloroflexi bacterium]|nr:MAG: hypothetical protein EHM41_00845 [Chloroflexota bacterium]